MTKTKTKTATKVETKKMTKKTTKNTATPKTVETPAKRPRGRPRKSSKVVLDDKPLSKPDSITTALSQEVDYTQQQLTDTRYVAETYVWEPKPVEAIEPSPETEGLTNNYGIGSLLTRPWYLRWWLAILRFLS